MVTKCDKFIVSGYVQGVGFRYHTSNQGLKLGLTGYAKNLNSGEVEVVACGLPEKLEQFYEWLHEGPKTASVEQVTRTGCLPEKEYAGFEIL
ncbi:acylphosphatase [Vibrio sp. AH4]|uniref:acylphosphatase n=1 Tax=Vibrio sp. AH4 TaxID=2919577 RepID=UPI00273A1B9B|nr:acylphosphatase [Vibrio sp. AH4]MDP4492793.1 acylphosphatase [Vibrio sp. AH4]